MHSTHSLLCTSIPAVMVCTHSLESQVLSVTSCSFDALPCLAVLETDRVTIYQQDGTIHSVSLTTVRPLMLWPLLSGVIIETALSVDYDSLSIASSVLAPLLLLERPLDEPLPLGGVGVILLSDPPNSRLLVHDRLGRRHVLLELRFESSLGADTRCGVELQTKRLHAIWQQEMGTAPLAAACHFIAPARGDAPTLLFLLQATQGHLYCFSLPHGNRGEASEMSSSVPSPLWSVPALTAQPLLSCLDSLAVASFIVLAPTGHLELYSCADDGSMRCLHRGTRSFTCMAGTAQGIPGQMWPLPPQLVPDRVRLVGAAPVGGSGRRGGQSLQIICPPLEPLVRLCLQVARLALAPRTFLGLLHAVVGPHMCFADGPITEPPMGSSANWITFAEALGDVIGMRREVGKAADRRASTAAPGAWQRLLRSSYHQRMGTRAPLHGLRPACSLPYSVTAGARGPVGVAASPEEVVRVTRELHMLYECLKLDTTAWPCLYQLASLLADIDIRDRRWKRACHYARDFGMLEISGAQEARRQPSEESPGVGVDAAFDVIGWLASVLAHCQVAPTGKGSGAPFVKALPVSVLLTATKGEHLSDQTCAAPLLALPAVVLSVYASMAAYGQSADAGVAVQTGSVCMHGRAKSLAETLVTLMVRAGLGPHHLETLPLGVALPLQEAIRTCRRHAPEGLSLWAYELIGRQDLARQQLQRLEVRPSAISLPPVGGARSAVTVDGMGAVMVSSALLFSADLRLTEVRRLLCSSRPLALHLNTLPELSDHDQLHEQQARLLLLCRRAMALPVGRGMFSLASASPRLTEALRMAPLVLKGRMPSTAATIDLDLSTLPPDQLHWPEFHNGTAAALRLCPPGCGESEEGELGRNWIVFNKPRPARQHAHAGFLLGLGLQGHLLALANTDLYRYMSQGHDVTMMAVLLGMAAARRGSMHNAIAKMLCLHIPSLHPPTFTELELEVPAVVQIAALLGVGLLYQGSAHRLMTEVMLDEIARPPTNELLACRESYALTAGLALGMLALGRGSDAAGLADLHLEDKLGNYMHGKELAPHWGPSFGAGAMPTLNSRNSVPPVASRCCRIREGPLINVDVTASGATLALALIFLKSNNASVAAQFRVPMTMFERHCVRPDLILLRVTARNLIMWDSVEPTSEWLASQVPSWPTPPTQPAHGCGPATARNVSSDPESIRLAKANSIAGACLALGLRFAGSCCAPACNLLYEQTRYLHSLRQLAASPKAEQPTLEACLGTAALALSLVMAGSGNLRCLRLLRLLRRRVDADVTYGFHMAIGMAVGFIFLGGGRLTLSTSKPAIAALLAALFPHFPHDPRDCRYHLQAFRHLYVLAAEARCVDAVDVDTGCAVLVPLKVHLNMHVQKQRQQQEHPPPLSKAAKSFEATSDQPMQPDGADEVVLTASSAAGGLLETLSPFPLPPLNAIRALAVCGPRYWPRELELSSGSWHATELRRRMLWVKRKIGHLAYLADPKGLSSMSCRHFPTVLDCPPSPQPLARTTAFATDYVSAFSSEPMLLAFTQHLCHSDRLAPPTPATAGNAKTSEDAAAAATLAVLTGGEASRGAALAEVRSFCEGVLYECLVHEKAEVLSSYLRLYHMSATLRHLPSSLPVHSLRLISAYYASQMFSVLLQERPFSADRETEVAGTTAAAEPLVQPTFFRSLSAQLDQLFSSMRFDHQLANHLASMPDAPHGAAAHVELSGTSAEQVRIMYAAFLTFHGIPDMRLVTPTPDASAELLPFIANSLAVANPLCSNDGSERHSTTLRVASQSACVSPWTPLDS